MDLEPTTSLLQGQITYNDSVILSCSIKQRQLIGHVESHAVSS